MGVWAVGYGLVILNLLTLVLSIAAIAVWFRRFGWFRFGDTEYEKAKRDMRNSMKFWIALLAVQSLVLVYVFRIHLITKGGFCEALLATVLSLSASQVRTGR